MKNINVKMIRLFYGMTQSTFAEAINVSDGTIAKVERGWMPLSDTTRAKILRRFNLNDPEYLAFVEMMNDSEIV